MLRARAEGARSAGSAIKKMTVPSESAITGIRLYLGNEPSFLSNNQIFLPLLLFVGEELFSTSSQPARQPRLLEKKMIDSITKNKQPS